MYINGKKIKYNKTTKIYIFLSIFVTAILLNNLFLIPHYSTDSYSNLFDRSINIYQSEALGRPLTSLFWYIINAFGVNVVEEQIFFTLISIFIMSIASFFIGDICLLIKQDHSLLNIIIINLASILIVFNSFSVEMFQFSYMLPFASVAVFFVVLSIRVLVTEITIKRIFISFIMISFSLFFYQGWGALFVPLALTILLFINKKRSFKALVSVSFKIFFIYGSACIVNLAYIKIIHPLFSGITIDARTTNEINLVRNIEEILRMQYDIWVLNLNMTPKYIFLGFVLILTLICFYFVMRENCQREVKKIAIIYSLVSILLITLSYLPHVATSVVWIVQRSLMALGALPGLLIIFIWLFTNNKNLESSNTIKQIENKVDYRNNKILLLLTSFAYFFVLFTSTSAIASDHLSTNKLDQEVAKLILENIEEKEEKLGITITKIAFINDTNPIWYYNNIIHYRDLNIRALNVDWSVIPLLQFVSKRKFERVDMDSEIYNKYFKGRDWDAFSNEQIVIENNVAYIVMF